MTNEDKDLIVGALDSLGLALAVHGHEWTEGERGIYEEAVKTLFCIVAEREELSGKAEASSNAPTPHQGASAPSQGAFTASSETTYELEFATEWSPAHVAQLMRGTILDDGFSKVAYGHNVAVAAVRKFWRDTYDTCHATLIDEREAYQVAIKDLRKLLGDEQEKRRIDLEHILDLERQLAGERERHAFDNTFSEKQLAAEREKSKSFAAALDEIATTGADTLDGYDAANIATAALARYNAGSTT